MANNNNNNNSFINFGSLHEVILIDENTTDAGNAINSNHPVNQGIPAIGDENAFYNIPMEVLDADLTGEQDPESSHLQQPLTDADVFARNLESLKIQFHNLRLAAYLDLWGPVPLTVNTQILFKTILVDYSPSFIIPTGIAMRFFPPLVDRTFEDVTVTSIHGEVLMRYEFDVADNCYQFTTGWVYFRGKHLLEIGDHVLVAVDRSYRLFVYTKNPQDDFKFHSSKKTRRQ